MSTSGGYGKGPPFDGTNYAYWKHRMKHHLTSIDPLIWPIVQDGFVVLDGTNPTHEELKKIHLNARATNSIFGSLSPDEYNRVSTLDSAKEVWDTLEEIHEGTPAVKETKIDVFGVTIGEFHHVRR